MHAFLSKVFGRKKEDKEPSPTSLQPGELLDGKFEAVSPNVSPAANNFLELDPKANGQDVQDKDKDGVFALFRAKSRPSSPEIKPKRLTDTLPQLSLDFAGPGESSNANTIDSLLELDIDSQILLSEAVIGERRLNPLEALVLIRACSQAIVSTGLETLGVMHPHWYSSSPEVQRRLISQFIHSLKPAPQGLLTPLSPNSTLLTPFEVEVKSRSPYDVAAVLRWGLRHLQIEGNQFGTDDGWYKAFLDAETAASYPPKAFSEKLAPKLPSAHLDLLIATLEIISSLASHSEANGTSGNKLSKIFGLWLLTSRRVEEKDDWYSFYQRWERTGRMLEHLFLARIRDESSDQRMPVRLLELVRKYPYTQGLSSPTTDLQLLPPSRFSTQPRDALFVRIEVELPSGKRKPKSKIHPLNLLADAFSTKVEEGDYVEIWAKITSASKNGTNPSPLSNIFADETIRFLSIIPEANKDKSQEAKSPAFSIVSPSSPRRQSFTVAENGKAEGQTGHTKVATDPLPITPVSATEIGSDWAQFSSSGFLDSNLAMPPLVSTLFDTDVEKTVPPDPALSRKSSKRTRPPAASRKSVDFPAEPIGPPPPKEKSAQDAEVKNVVKASKIEIVQVDEAFIDFWSDSLLDPITLSWPTFIICKFKSTLVPQLTYGPAVEGQKQKTLKWLVLEQVFTVRSPTPPPPVETIELASPSSPTPSTSSRKIFSFFSRSTSGSSIGSQKGKKKEKTPKIGEMGELLEEDAEVGQPRISFSRSKKSMDRRMTTDSIPQVEEKDKVVEKTVSDNKAAAYVGAAVAISAVSAEAALAATSTEDPKETEQLVSKDDKAETENSSPIAADAPLASTVDELTEAGSVPNAEKAELQLSDTVAESPPVSTTVVEPIDELTEQVQPLGALVTETSIASAVLDESTEPAQFAHMAKETETQPFDNIVSEMAAKQPVPTIEEVDIKPSVAVVSDMSIVLPSVDEPLKEVVDAMPIVEEANVQPPGTFVSEKPPIASSQEQPAMQPALTVVETELQSSDATVTETSIPTKVEQSVPTVGEVEIESSSAIVTEAPPVSISVDGRQGAQQSIPAFVGVEIQPSATETLLETIDETAASSVESEGEVPQEDLISADVAAVQQSTFEEDISRPIIDVSFQPLADAEGISTHIGQEIAELSPNFSSSQSIMLEGEPFEEAKAEIENEREAISVIENDDHVGVGFTAGQIELPLHEVENVNVSSEPALDEVTVRPVVENEERGHPPVFTADVDENMSLEVYTDTVVQSVEEDNESDVQAPSDDHTIQGKTSPVSGNILAESIANAEVVPTSEVTKQSIESATDAASGHGYVQQSLADVESQLMEPAVEKAIEVFAEGSAKNIQDATLVLDESQQDLVDDVQSEPHLSIVLERGQVDDNGTKTVSEVVPEGNQALSDETIAVDITIAEPISDDTREGKNQSEGIEHTTERDFTFKGETIPSQVVASAAIEPYEKSVTESPQQEEASVGEAEALETVYSNEAKEVDVAPVLLEDVNDIAEENNTAGLDPCVQLSQTSNEEKQVIVDVSPFVLPTTLATENAEVIVAKELESNVESDAIISKDLTESHLKPSDESSPGDDKLETEEASTQLSAPDIHKINTAASAGLTENPVAGEHATKEEEEKLPRVEEGESNNTAYTQPAFGESESPHVVQDGEEHNQEVQSISEANSSLLADDLVSQDIENFDIIVNDGDQQRADLKHDEPPVVISSVETVANQENPPNTAVDLRVPGAPLPAEDNDIHKSVPLEEATADEGHLSTAEAIIEADNGSSDLSSFTIPESIALENVKEPNEAVDTPDLSEDLPANSPATEVQDLVNPSAGPAAPSEVQLDLLASSEAQVDGNAISQKETPEEGIPIESSRLAALILDGSLVPGSIVSGNNSQVLATVEEHGQDTALRTALITKDNVSAEGQVAAPGILETYASDPPPIETLVAESTENQLSEKGDGVEGDAQAIETALSQSISPEEGIQGAADDQFQGNSAKQTREINASGIIEADPSQTFTLAASELDKDLPADHPKEQPEKQDIVDDSNISVETVAASGESEDGNDPIDEQDIYLGSAPVKRAQEELSIPDTKIEEPGEVASQTGVPESIEFLEDVVALVEEKSNDDLIITKTQMHGNTTIDEEGQAGEAAARTDTANSNEKVSSSVEPSITGVSSPEDPEPTSIELDTRASRTHVTEHVVEKSSSLDDTLPPEPEFSTDKTESKTSPNEPDSSAATQPVPELSTRQALPDSDGVAEVSADLVVSPLQEAATTEVSAQDVECTHKDHEAAAFISPKFGDSSLSETDIHVTRQDEPLTSVVDLAVADSPSRSAVELEAASVLVTQGEVNDSEEPEILKEIDTGSSVEELPQSTLQSQNLSDSAVPTDGHHLEKYVSTPGETIIVKEYPPSEQERTSDPEQIRPGQQPIEDEEVQVKRNSEPAEVFENETELVEPAEYGAESARVETVETPHDEAQSARAEAGSDQVNHLIGLVEAEEHVDEPSAIVPVELDEPELTHNAEAGCVVAHVFDAEMAEREPEAIEVTASEPNQPLYSTEAQSGEVELKTQDDAQDVLAQPESQSNVENASFEPREAFETRLDQTQDVEPQPVGQPLKVELAPTSEFQRSENLQEYTITSQPEKNKDDTAKVEDTIEETLPESIAEIATTTPESVESIDVVQQEEPEEHKEDYTILSASKEGVGSIIGEEGSSLNVEESLNTPGPSELITSAIVKDLDKTPSGAPDASASDELKTDVIVDEPMSQTEEAPIQVTNNCPEETTSTEDNVMVLPESSESLEGGQTRSDAKDDTGLESVNISGVHSKDSSSDVTEPVIKSNGPSDALNISEPVSIEQDVEAFTILTTIDDVTGIPTENEPPSLAKEAVGVPGLSEVSITPDGEISPSLRDPTSAEKDAISLPDVADPVMKEGSSTLAEEIVAISEPSEAPPVAEESDPVTSSVAAPEVESSEKSDVIDTATHEEVVPDERSEPNLVLNVKEHIPSEEVREARFDNELPVVIAEGVATSVGNSIPEEPVLSEPQTNGPASPNPKPVTIPETDNEVVAEEPSSVTTDGILGISEPSEPPIPVVPEDSNTVISSVGGPDALGIELETIETTTNQDVVLDEEVSAGETNDLPVREPLAQELNLIQEMHPAQKGSRELSKSLEIDSVAEVQSDHEDQLFTREPKPEIVVEGEAAAEVADSIVLTELELASPPPPNTADLIPEAVTESQSAPVLEETSLADSTEDSTATIDEPEIPPADEGVTPEVESTVQDDVVIVDQDIVTVAEESAFVDDDVITNEADPVEVTETTNSIQELPNVPAEENHLEQVADIVVSDPSPGQPTETKVAIIEDPMLDVDPRVEHAEADSLNGNGYHSVDPVTEKDDVMSEILQAVESVNGTMVDEATITELKEPITSDVDDDITPTINSEVTAEDVSELPEAKEVINVLDPEPKADNEQLELAAESIAKEPIFE